MGIGQCRLVLCHPFSMLWPLLPLLIFSLALRVIDVRGQPLIIFAALVDGLTRLGYLFLVNRHGVSHSQGTNHLGHHGIQWAGRVRFKFPEMRPPFTGYFAPLFPSGMGLPDFSIGMPNVQGD